MGFFGFRTIQIPYTRGKYRLNCSSTAVLPFHTLLESREVQVRQDEKRDHCIEEVGGF